MLDISEFSQQTLQQIKSGLFLTVGGEHPNTMTIGWGSLSVYWGKPVFIAPVRHSRYSFGLLENGAEFTVSVPAADDPAAKEALIICGRKSGRDTDKYALSGLKTAPSKQLLTPVIKGCDYYYECKVLYSTDLDLSRMPADVVAACYPAGDEHRLYFGEVIACYKGDK